MGALKAGLPRYLYQLYYPQDLQLTYILTNLNSTWLLNSAKLEQSKLPQLSDFCQILFLHQSKNHTGSFATELMYKLE